MKNTWASGALELLKHADSHTELKTAFDKRIAFISIDNSVEVSIRTFLSLPSKISGVKISKKDLDETENSFPKMVALLFNRSPERVVGLDDGDIEHYHRIRNQVYHNGTGLSVDDIYLSAYRQIAAILLDSLFKIDPKPSKNEKPSLERLILLWNRLEKLLQKNLREKGINVSHSIKLEKLKQIGVLNSGDIDKILELRRIRNVQVHSQVEEIDAKEIVLGVTIAEQILDRLSGSQETHL